MDMVRWAYYYDIGRDVVFKAIFGAIIIPRKFKLQKGKNGFT